ncbi:MAG: hypothetical protein KGD64_08435 [Candidatus Heimdallarchaeota archaeon]|nr:hypothetical protein [Candidatus Heimdallarchaeota archaeon]
MTPNDVLFDKYQVLKQKAQAIAHTLSNSEDNVIIITAENPDSLCATGILLLNFKEKKMGAHVIYGNEKVQIEKRIKKFEYKIIICIGFNLNEIPVSILKDENKKRVIIHHELTKKEVEKISKENVDELSLEPVGLAKDTVSNAGLCYFIASGFNGDYQKYSPLAIIGGLAKRQVDSKTQSLIGLYAIILDEGKKEQYLNVTTGTRIAGRESQPIHYALKYSINPYFPGLTGNESACTSFLSRTGITMKDQEDEWRTIASLSSEETKKLNDGLVSILMENKNHSINDIRKLIGPIYVIENESEKKPTRNAEEFLWLLEGACQIGKYGLALSVILGDRENSFDQLYSELSDYHGRATNAIDEIAQKPEIIKEKKYYRIITGNELFDRETAPVIINALIDSKTITIDTPLLVSVEQAEETYLFVHESPSEQERGIKLYHIFQEAEKDKIVNKLSKEGDFFEVSIETDKFSEVIKKVEQMLEYHHEGAKEVEVKEKQTTTSSQASVDIKTAEDKKE